MLRRTIRLRSTVRALVGILAVIVCLRVYLSNVDYEGPNKRMAQYLTTGILYGNAGVNRAPFAISRRKAAQTKGSNTSKGDYSNNHTASDRKDGEGSTSMMERKNVVKKTCGVTGGRARLHIVQKHLLASRRHGLLYCPVEKTASTFWRRFMYQLENTDPFESPFDVSAQQVYNAMGHTMTSRSKFAIKEKGVQLSHMINTYTKLLFVRDPYGRLFSAYVDKLIAPNPLFWEEWGIPALKLSRASDKLGCGSDVSFSEFVRIVLKNFWRSDVHVMPIYRLCNPCYMDYTVIGKMESFNGDVTYLTSLLNISARQLAMERMEDDLVSDAILDSVHDPFSKPWMQKLLQCADKQEVVMRIWRKLQIRGFISWRIKFDLLPEECEELDEDSYIDILQKAHRVSVQYKHELKQQKRQAFLEAFQTIRNSQLKAIVYRYKEDFQMFGYSYALQDIKRNVKMTGAFDWRKDWDLSEVFVS